MRLLVIFITMEAKVVCTLPSFFRVNLYSRGAGFLAGTPLLLPLLLLFLLLLPLRKGIFHRHLMTCHWHVRGLSLFLIQIHDPSF
jgi:hypothetical protein